MEKKKDGQKVKHLISKKKKLNNKLNFSFYLLIFSLKSESNIDIKIYLNFNTHISTTKIIIYFFFHFV